MSLLIAQITDTHIVAEGKNLCGNSNINTHKDLIKVIERINEMRPLPDLVIHTGDLSDEGDLQSYHRAKLIMDDLKVPYYITCGNHDIHANLQEVFNQPWMDDRYACISIDGFEQKIIILDSTLKDKVEGELCSKRLNWLRNELKTDKEVYIFMHHYPMLVPHKTCNRINLTNADEFAAILTPNVKGIYCGHYHLGCYGSFSNKLCWISPSVAPQFDMINADIDEDVYLLLTPPTFSLHKFDVAKGNFSRIVFCADKFSRDGKEN